MFMKKYYIIAILIASVSVIGFYFWDMEEPKPLVLESLPSELSEQEPAESPLDNQAGKQEEILPIDVMYEWIEKGITRKSAGDFAGAAEAWKQASLANPGSYLPHNNLGYLYRYDIKDPIKAEKSFLDAIAVKDDLTMAYRELSDLYRYAYPEKQNQADDILLFGLQKNPDHYDLLIYLALYYRDTGDKDNAKKYFEEALKSRPNESGILRELQKLSQ